MSLSHDLTQDFLGPLFALMHEAIPAVVDCPGLALDFLRPLPTLMCEAIPAFRGT